MKNIPKKIPMEINDDMLNTVVGGAGVEVSAEAAAEGLNIGTELICSCIMCGNQRYIVSEFISDIKFWARCSKCGYRGIGTLKAYGGTGWELA